MAKRKRKKSIRKKGTGQVRFRGHGVNHWYLDYYDKQGKRHQEITNAKSKKEAIEELEKKRSLICLGLDEPKEEKPVILFKDYAGQWYERREAELKAEDIAESTVINYQSILDNHLNSHFGNIPLNQITKIDIKNFVTEKKAVKSKKTVRNIVGVLHQILSEAEDDGVISISPYPKTRLLKKKKTKKIEDEDGNKKLDYLELHQIPIFLNACPEDYYCLFYTAIHAGPRRGELLGLKWKDIDFINEQIHIRRSLYKGKVKTPKTETSERSVDIGPTHIEVLKQHRKRMIEAMLKNGRPLDGDNLYHRVFKPILKKSKLQITIHGLRHTFASILIGAGHNLKYVSDQMGHSNIQTTLNIYTHLFKISHEGAGKITEDWITKQLNKKKSEAILGDR